MTFAQLHDGFYRNPKVQAAGSVGAWMWVASIGYASEGLTDGFIPLVALASLCPDLDAKPRLKVAARLVEVGLWEVADGGWRVHDYLNWNFSKAAVLAKREATLARVNKHRNGPRHGEGNAVVMRSNASSNAGCNAVTAPVTNAVGNTTPSDPTSSSEETTSLLSPAGATPSGATSTDPAETPKATKGKRPKRAPEPDTIPLPGTLARRIFDAIVGDRALAPITGNPGDAAQRWADPDTFPGVDVLAEVRRAGEYAATKPGRYTDGRAFLRGWLQRKADEVARMPKAAGRAGAGVVPAAPRPVDPAPVFVDLGRNCKPLHRGA